MYLSNRDPWTLFQGQALKSFLMSSFQSQHDDVLLPVPHSQARENPTHSDFESAKWLMELIVLSALVAAWKQKGGVDTIGQRTFSTSDNNSAAHFCLFRDMLPAVRSYRGPAHLCNLLQFLAFSPILSNIVLGFTLVPIRTYRNPVMNKANPEK